MITISKQLSGRWILDYNAPEGAKVGGIRISCASEQEAKDEAVQFAKFAGIECNVKIIKEAR